jgi:hypothetical protein
MNVLTKQLLSIKAHKPQLVCSNSLSWPTLSLNLEHEIDDSVGEVGCEALLG